jgi:hypothetical protein
VITRSLESHGPRVSGLGCMGMSDVYGPADEAEGDFRGFLLGFTGEKLEAFVVDAMRTSGKTECGTLHL